MRKIAALAAALVVWDLLPLRTALASGVDLADCPVGRQPYSIHSPLFDLLIDPAARAVVARLEPELLKSPVGEWSTTLPSFAMLMSPQSMLARRPDGSARLAALESALARVRVSQSAAQRRCARYDNEPPALPSPLSRPAILVYGKVTGFLHVQSPDAAYRAVEQIAARRGWSIVRTNNAAVFNERDLAQFDTVVWNNVSGDGLTLSQ
ncbi:MAG: ThuA domain-containing protein, partial [Gammaproteobacteria bacterium]|nr:ThuA domain-containing protein [Gammaproteobacteria bacterium]